MAQSHRIYGDVKQARTEDETIRILAFDLETTPHQVYTWGVWQQDVHHEQVIREGGTIICGAWRYTDEKKCHVASIDANQADVYDDKKVVRELYEAISEADILLAHNGDAFDIKIFNTRAVYHGFPPIQPKQTIDTLKAAKKHFRFARNRLDHLGDRLGCGRKIDTGGFRLWSDIVQAKEKAERCLDPERREKALRKMVKYNKRDVDLLIDVYHELAPWMQSHPNVAVRNPDIACRICGSERVTAQGTKETKTAIYQQYRCKDCGAWSRSRKADKQRPALTA